MFSVTVFAATAHAARKSLTVDANDRRISYAGVWDANERGKHVAASEGNEARGSASFYFTGTSVDFRVLILIEKCLVRIDNINIHVRPRGCSCVRCRWPYRLVRPRGAARDVNH